MTSRMCILVTGAVTACLLLVPQECHEHKLRAGVPPNRPRAIMRTLHGLEIRVGAKRPMYTIQAGGDLGGNTVGDRLVWCTPGPGGGAGQEHNEAKGR